MVTTCEVRLPPLPLEGLRGAHLLTSDKTGDLDLALLFQFRDDMWSVALRPGQPDKVAAVFDGTGRTMKHQFAVKRR